MTRTGSSRRDFLKYTAAMGLAAGGALGGRLPAALAAAGGTVTLADIGVGDPDGDWSRFTKPTGWNVNLVAIGNAPSTVLNVLVAGGGAKIYDIANIVGGMQKPLVENDLIEPIDTSKMPNWGKDTYVSQFLADVIDWRFWHDWFHEKVIAGTYNWLSNIALNRYADQRGIDAIANGLATVTQWLSVVLRRVQNGFVRSYALSVLLGVVLIVGYLILK